MLGRCGLIVEIIEAPRLYYWAINPLWRLSLRCMHCYKGMSDFIASHKILKSFSSKLLSVIRDNCFRHSKMKNPGPLESPYCEGTCSKLCAMTGASTAWAYWPRTSAAETTSVRGGPPITPAKEHQRSYRRRPADAAKAIFLRGQYYKKIFIIKKKIKTNIYIRQKYCKIERNPFCPLAVRLYKKEVRMKCLRQKGV